MEMRERMARCMWFGHCDYAGWPNGLPTYDELPQYERDRLLYQADLLIDFDKKAATHDP